MRVHIDVALMDGKRYSKDVNKVRALSRDEQVRRYEELASRRLKPPQIERSLELMLNLENVAELGELLDILVYC